MDYLKFSLSNPSIICLSQYTDEVIFFLFVFKYLRRLNKRRRPTRSSLRYNIQCHRELMLTGNKKLHAIQKLTLYKLCMQLRCKFAHEQLSSHDHSYQSPSRNENYLAIYHLYPIKRKIVFCTYMY